MNQFKIDQCHYCGSTNIGMGYQSGYAAVSSTRNIFKSSKIYYTICSDCGSILHSYVSDPYKFKPR
jgi:hypothetical protein